MRKFPADCFEVMNDSAMERIEAPASLKKIRTSISCSISTIYCYFVYEMNIFTISSRRTNLSVT